jgi:hypothetical protein
VKFYRLAIAGSKSDADGDEWFGALRAARKRRTELIRETPLHAVGDEDFEIELVELLDVAKKKLLLEVLNRRPFVKRRAIVMPPHRPRGQLKLRNMT